MTGWASGSGRRIGTGWNQFRTVLGSTDGSLYGVRADGTIHYYRYVCTNYTTGAGYWSGSRQIGAGFQRFPRLFVFSASSITFAGALDSDPALSRIFRNVFTLALEKGPAVRRTRAPMRRTEPAPAQPEPTPLE
ncbi:hypothetical protein C5N14_16780 [Micromonospora sp. MW-13]|uniref:tachylectin-related carbohydrate-binding protein n=1 Tax=Micromonospora sp. MW-13 TaxID=2094022 RepID=UPI000E43B26C|nr:tachylectin-related carbohydrate-binding protein [Micromonospora sp. MW-13]RGC67864.1 hypothetical protein C5N14_16780 [Micromonospora sp. MW-13]